MVSCPEELEHPSSGVLGWTSIRSLIYAKCASVEFHLGFVFKWEIFFISFN